MQVRCCARRQSPQYRPYPLPAGSIPRLGVLKRGGLLARRTRDEAGIGRRGQREAEGIKALREHSDPWLTERERLQASRRVLGLGVSGFRADGEGAFAGKVLLRVAKDKFFQFLWRPRPPSLLSPEKEKEIRKKLPEYSKRYEEEDRQAREFAETEHLREKKKKRDEFEKGEELRKKLYLEWQKERRELRGCVTDDEEEYELVEETFEELINTKEEKMI